MRTPYLARIISAVSRPERRADTSRPAASSGLRATTPACSSTAISRSSSPTLPCSPVDEGAPSQRGTHAGRSRDSDPRSASQLPAGTDAELGEHVAQMPLDGPRAEEEPRTDLRIRQALARPGRAICRSCAVRSSRVSTVRLRTFSPVASSSLRGALGERLHPDRGEHFVGGAELVARVDPAVLAAQPLPVEQMSPGELGTQPGPASLSIASRCRRSALSPSLKSARQRAWIPRPQSVLAGRGGRHHALERTGRDLGPPRSGPPLRPARSMPRGRRGAAVSPRPLVGPRRAPGRSGPAR